MCFLSFFSPSQIYHEVQDPGHSRNMGPCEHPSHAAVISLWYCQSAYSAGSTMPYLLQWRHLQQYPDTDVQDPLIVHVI